MIRALGQIGDETAKVELERLCGSREGWVADAATQALEVARSPRATVTQPKVEAAPERGPLPPGADYRSVIIEMLLAFDQAEGPQMAETARQAIDIILGSSDRERFLALVAELREHDDEAVRSAATSAMEYCRPEATGGLLIVGIVIALAVGVAVAFRWKRRSRMAKAANLHVDDPG